MKRSVKINNVFGEIKAPPSKSVAQRAAAIALLMEDNILLRNMKGSRDIEASIDAVRGFGSKIEWHENDVFIEGSIRDNKKTIDVGESGTAFRMFSPIAALLNSEITMTGSGSLSNRPMQMVEESLSQLGVFCKTDSGHLPIIIKGPYKKNSVTIDGSLSSQLLTGLLIAQGQNQNGFTIYAQNLKSRPYIDLTISMMKDFGVQVDNSKYEKFFIAPNQKYEMNEYLVEGDWSGISFYIVLASVKGQLRIENLNENSSQGDKILLDIVKNCGADVISNENDILIKSGKLRPFSFDAVNVPDLFPPLVSLASYIDGVSEIGGVSRLKHKESDRATVLKEQFLSLGIDINIENDKMYITGGTLKGGTVNSNNDHRIAMAAAICSLNNTVIIEDSDCVEKSYKNFFNDFKKIGGIIE